MSQVQSETSQSMFSSTIQQTCDAPATSRQKLTNLRRLESLLPARFIVFLSWACCFGAVPALSPAFLYREALRYATQEFDVRKREVLGALKYNKATSRFEPTLVDGWPVCTDCFTGLYGISDSDWKRMRKASISGQAWVEHGNCGSVRGPTVTGMSTRAWMHDYFATVGDFQPGMTSSFCDCVFTAHVW